MVANMVCQQQQSLVKGTWICGHYLVAAISLAGDYGDYQHDPRSLARWYVIGRRLLKIEYAMLHTFLRFGCKLKIIEFAKNFHFIFVNYIDLRVGSVTPTGQRSGYFRFSDAQNLWPTPEFLRKICTLLPPRIFAQNMYPSQEINIPPS